MQTAAIGKPGVDERLRAVQSPAGTRQHALDQLLDVTRFEHDAGQLVLTATCREHAPGFVHPDLFDLRVIQERRDRTESHDPLTEQRDIPIGERWESTGEVSVSVVQNDFVDERTQRTVVIEREFAPTQQFTNVLLHQFDRRRDGYRVHDVTAVARTRNSRSHADRGAISCNGRPSHTTRANSVS